MMKRFLCSVAAIVGFAGAAQACPDFNQWGESYRVSGPQMRSPVRFNVVAGGDNYIWNCSHIRPGTDQGAGYFTTPPDFTFELSQMQGLKLEISVVSACDSALLINTSSANWYYDDDDNGDLDPKIILTRPVDGYLDVWIGTYNGQYCDAVLTLETFRK